MRAYRAQVDAARGPIEIIGQAAEIGAQEGNIFRRQICSGMDPQPRHLFRAFRPHAMETPHWQRSYEAGAFAGLDDA